MECECTKLDEPTTHELDVCEDLANGREPCGRIMQAANAVPAGGRLRLITPFLPKPLVAVLGGRGFSAASRQLGEDRFETIFSKSSDAPAPDRSPGPPSERPPGEPREVDARGLEPPQPMVLALDAVGALKAGESIRLLTDRRPAHLFALIEERGCAWETVQLCKHHETVVWLRV